MRTVRWDSREKRRSVSLTMGEGVDEDADDEEEEEVVVDEDDDDADVLLDDWEVRRVVEVSE